MRKITEQAVRAFNNNREFRQSNTEVVNCGSEMRMFLWGNCIAKKSTYNNSLEINLCGWNSNTTRERLNGLCGVNLTTRKGTVTLNGKEIPCDEWVKVVTRL